MEYAIIGALLELAFFGLLFGVGLALAAKKFAVEVDPRVEMILEILPNANCGACGYPGCSGFAKAVVAGEASVSGCTPGGAEVAQKTADILGVVAEATEPLVAVVRCNGGIRAKDKFKYDGIADCRAAMLVANGYKMCTYGCLGFGTCVNACPFGALSMGSEGLPINDFEKCTGCGICVDVCPTGVLQLVPKNKPIFVACNSRDKGAFVRKACKSGCIACMLCEKNCPYDAIHISENIARIDFNKCKLCGICIEVCPTKTILNKFHKVLQAHNGIPVPIPIKPEATKKLLEKIKEKKKQKTAENMRRDKESSAEFGSTNA